MRTALCLLLLVCLATLPVAWSGHRLWLAEQELAGHRSSATIQVDQLRRITRLRQQQERVSDRKRPEQDVIARVNTVLAEVGIPVHTLGSVRPENDVVVASGDTGRAYRRQSVRLTLGKLQIPDLGAFLAEWRATQLLWKPTRIELTHVRQSVGPALYDVTLIVSATYIAGSSS